MVSVSFQPKEGDTAKDVAKRQAQRFGRAIVATAKQVAASVQQRGRIDIASAGAFGQKWIFGLHVFRERQKRGSNRQVVTVKHNIPFFDIFEHGGTIRGKPLLWIPFPEASAAQGSFGFAGPAKTMRAKTFMKTEPLFQITSKRGTPLLINRQGVPMFHGVRSITEAKKFHITEISESEANKASEYFSAYLNKPLRKR